MASPEYIRASLSRHLFSKEEDGHPFRGNQHTGGIPGTGLRDLVRRRRRKGVLNSVQRVGVIGRSEMSDTPAIQHIVEQPYQIKEASLEKLQTKLAVLNRKAKKLGVPEAQLTVGKPYLVADTHRPDGAPYKAGEIRSYTSTVEVRLDRPIVKLDGWRVVASVILDAPEGQPQVVRTVPGEISEPSWVYTTDKCDQCRLPSKGRKKIVMVRNDDGRTAQVGSTCLKDFLGHDANSLLMWADTEFGSLVSDINEAARVPASYNTSDVLAVVATVMRRRGYVSAAASGVGSVSTRMRVDGWFLAAGKGKHEDGADSYNGELAETVLPEDRLVANAALEWAKSIDISGNADDYLRNLGVLAARPTVASRDFGYLSSLIAAHQKSLQNAALKTLAAPTAPRTNVPMTGKREVFTGTVLGYKSVDTGYGVTVKVRFLDDRGFVLWGTDPDAGENIGDRISFEAKVTGVSESDPTFGFFQRPSKAQDLPKEPVSKEEDGHPFRGNQHTGGIPGAGSPQGSGRNRAGIVGEGNFRGRQTQGEYKPYSFSGPTVLTFKRNSAGVHESSDGLFKITSYPPSYWAIEHTRPMFRGKTPVGEFIASAPSLGEAKAILESVAQANSPDWGERTATLGTREHAHRGRWLSHSEAQAVLRQATNASPSGSGIVGQAVVPLELPDSEIKSIIESDTTIGKKFAQIYKRLGKDIKPKVADFPDSEISTYRGLDTPKRDMKRLLAGSIGYADFQTWGNGLYVTSEREVAHRYATTGDSKGTVIPLRIDPSAKIIKGEDAFSDSPFNTTVWTPSVVDADGWTTPGTPVGVIDWQRLTDNATRDSRHNMSFTDILALYWAGKGYDGFMPFDSAEIVFYNPGVLTVRPSDVARLAPTPRVKKPASGIVGQSGPVEVGGSSQDEVLTAMGNDEWQAESGPWRDEVTGELTGHTGWVRKPGMYRERKFIREAMQVNRDEPLALPRYTLEREYGRGLPMTHKDWYTDLGPIKYVYRGISEADYQRMRTQGVVNSDGRGNIESSEGLVTATDGRSAFSYLHDIGGSKGRDNPSGMGRIIKIRVEPGDGWRTGPHDSYIKTNSLIPFDRVEVVSKPIKVTRIPHARYPDNWTTEMVFSKEEDGHPFRGNQHTGGIQGSGTTQGTGRSGIIGNMAAKVKSRGAKSKPKLRQKSAAPKRSMVAATSDQARIDIVESAYTMTALNGEWSSKVTSVDSYGTRRDTDESFEVQGQLLSASGEEIGEFTRTVYILPGETEYSVYHDSVYVKAEHQKKGIGAEFVTRSMRAMADAGVKVFNLTATNGPDSNGLVTWAKLGFKLKPFSIRDGLSFYRDDTEGVKILSELGKIYPGVDHLSEVTAEMIADNSGLFKGVDCTARMTFLAKDLPEDTRVAKMYETQLTQAEWDSIIGEWEEPLMEEGLSKEEDGHPFRGNQHTGGIPGAGSTQGSGRRGIVGQAEQKFKHSITLPDGQTVSTILQSDQKVFAVYKTTSAKRRAALLKEKGNRFSESANTFDPAEHARKLALMHPDAAAMFAAPDYKAKAEAAYREASDVLASGQDSYEVVSWHGSQAKAESKAKTVRAQFGNASVTVGELASPTSRSGVTGESAVDRAPFISHDTQLGVLMGELGKTRNELSLATAARDQVAAFYTKKLASGSDINQQEGSDRIATLDAGIGDIQDRVDAATSAIYTHEAGYTGWPRYFVVTSSNGHIHATTACPTTRFTTTFAPIVSLSGANEDEAVGIAGEHLCSVCFSSAPVSYKGSTLTQEETTALLSATTGADFVQSRADSKAAATKVRTDKQKSIEDKLLSPEDPDGYLVGPFSNEGDQYVSPGQLLYLSTTRNASMWMTGVVYNGWSALLDKTDYVDPRDRIRAALAFADNFPDPFVGPEWSSTVEDVHGVSKLLVGRPGVKETTEEDVRAAAVIRAKKKWKSDWKSVAKYAGMS